MKLLTALLVLLVAVVGGGVILKRLTRGAELPSEGVDISVPLTDVPTLQEMP